MEQNILNALQGLEGEIKATNKSAYINFEYGGWVKIERGNFSEEICFYARVSETKHKGIVSIDDWDINDRENTILNGLPIDNINSFTAKLNEWGLSGVANKLKFTNDEQKNAIFMVMLEDETLKKLFGKKFKIWDLLSNDEKKLVDLQYIVNNFESCGEYIKKEIAQHYKIGIVEQLPTLEQYQEKLAELSK